jgi:acetyltransferase-like isoleucine patch superfamily enzyme
MLNNKMRSENFQEHIGCIDIRDNVFIGSNTTILPNVMIGPNTIIAAGSLVNKSISGNGVYGGVPVRYICSLDELIDKRRKESHIEITRGKGGLSKETVEMVWKRFKENN